MNNIGRILVIGDLQFKLSNAEESELLVENVLDIVRQYCPDKVVILGDVLEDKSTIKLYPFNRAVKFIIKLASTSRVFLIIGNHDRPDHKVFMTDEHAFNALKYVPNIVVIDKTYVEYPLVFVPYVETGRFKEAIKDVDLSKTLIIFAHQEFENSIMSNRGDPWPKEYPLVISGHIHSEKILQSNVMYVGSPMKHSFYDNGGRCVYLFELEYVNNEPRLMVNRIETNVPDKVLIKIKEEELEETLSKISKDGRKDDKYLIIVESKTKLMNEYYSNNIKILYKPIEEYNSTNNKPIITERQMKSFISRVKDKIKDNKELEELLDEIMNGL